MWTKREKNIYKNKSELKNIITETKNILEEINKRLEDAEEQINYLEDSVVEIIQPKQQKLKKKEFKIWG